jgi:hypothetical protein
LPASASFCDGLAASLDQLYFLMKVAQQFSNDLPLLLDEVKYFFS